MSPKSHLSHRSAGDSLILFTRQMDTLLKGGVPLLKALETLSIQSLPRPWPRILAHLARTVRDGHPLSHGLQEFPRIFDPLYLNTIRAGESGSALPDSFSRLATLLAGRRRLRRKALAAAAYPVSVLTLCTGILILLFLFVVPQFQSIYSRLMSGDALPPLTAFILGASDILRRHAVPVIGTLLLLPFVAAFLSRLTVARNMAGRVVLLIPLLGHASLIQSFSRFSRTLGTLLASGVPLNKALGITQQQPLNPVVAKATRSITHSVGTGEKLADALSWQQIYPPSMVALVEVGEETGTLDELLLQIADDYDEELEHIYSTCITILEPLMVFVIALFVGVVATALFLPMVSLIERLSQ